MFDIIDFVTGKMGIKYGAVFMPYLPQRRAGTITENRADLRGAVHIYTVLRLFLTDLEDGIRQDIRSVPSINVFFPFHTVANTVLWDRTVVLTVFVTFTEYEGHRLQALV